jgi:hypothetical protein
MKAIVPIFFSAILLLNPLLATAITPPILISQNSTSVTTNDDDGIQTTTVSIDRADLSEPHILRVQGSPRMERVEMKINGKVVKSIVNDTLEVNLAPMMTSGRYEIDVAGTLPQANNTVSVNFVGKNTNVTQQFSGNRTINQKLVINVR